MVCGIDGCRAGWFAVFLHDSGWKTAVYPDLKTFWDDKGQAVSSVLIDIPIGYPSGPDERNCDRAARAALGRRASSIFRVPCREALYCQTYHEANMISRLHTGKGLSRQTFNIMPKMREADQLFKAFPSAKKVCRESHPELCFVTISANNIVHGKASESGFRERCEILASISAKAMQIVEHSLKNYLRKDVARDDIADALVLAICAQSSLTKSLPETPEYDSSILKMEIVYPV